MHYSRWKAAFERQQPLRVSLQPDAAREQRPQKIPLARQKSQPRFRIGDDLKVRLSEQAVLDRDFSFANHHPRFRRLVAGEKKMGSSVQFTGSMTLKRKRHSKQQRRNVSRPRRIAHMSHGLVRITLLHVRFSV